MSSCLSSCSHKSQQAWQPEYHELRGTRLGEGLKAARQLDDAAMQRTLAAVKAMASLAHAADERLGIGTSALREAVNSPAFALAFAQATGAELAILTGDEEARYSYAGALMGLAAAGIDFSNGACVADIGGGSTEIAAGGAALDPEIAMSVELGAVGLTETTMPSDPPTADEIERATMTARLALQAAVVRTNRADSPLVAVGGTADAAAHMLLAYEAAVRAGTGPAIVRASDLDALLKLVLSVPTEQRKKLRGLPEQRADIFPAGLIIFVELLAALGRQQATVTQSDLLLGYIARHA